MVKENFFDDLLFYDKDNMSDEVFDMLTKIIKFDTSRPEFVACSSKAVSSLWAWILAVFEYAKLLDHKRQNLNKSKLIKNFTIRSIRRNY